MNLSSERPDMSEVLTEEEKELIAQNLRPYAKSNSLTSRVTAIIDRLCTELTSLRAERDKADDSIRKLFVEINPDLGGPENDCVQTLIVFAREWHRQWKAEETKVGRLVRTMDTGRAK